MTLSATKGLRAGYDFCGYRADGQICPPHGPCDCRDDDLGPFDDQLELDVEHAASSEYRPSRRMLIRRGGKLVEISSSPSRETRG